MIVLDFHPELVPLLKKGSSNPVVDQSGRRANLKDMVEAAGVPHTEVWSGELADGRRVGLDHIPAEGERIAVLPWAAPVDRGAWGFADTPPRFTADANVARLGRYLRLCGFDTVIAGPDPDERIAAAASKEERILLSRDRGLLMRKQIKRGRLIRECRPERQLGEVIAFFGLAGMLRPQSRCPVCNHETRMVAKEAVLHRLEPLTRKYYHRFRQCPDCGRIYWPGSHHERFAAVIARALEQTSPEKT